MNVRTIIILYFCLQDTKRTNFENWFDVNEVVANKRGQIAQIIRETFPEKNFPIFSTATNQQVPLTDSMSSIHQSSIQSVSYKPNT
jgi:hypothetical protein